MSWGSFSEDRASAGQERKEGNIGLKKCVCAKAQKKKRKSKKFSVHKLLLPILSLQQN
jgi:hypothetical protein